MCVGRQLVAAVVVAVAAGTCSEIINIIICVQVVCAYVEHDTFALGINKFCVGYHLNFK